MKLFEDYGFIVREISELKELKGPIKDIINEFYDHEKIVSIADIVRNIILYEEGGFYLDIDFYIEKYSIEIHKLFDFFGFTLKQKN